MDNEIVMGRRQLKHALDLCGSGYVKVQRKSGPEGYGVYLTSMDYPEAGAQHSPHEPSEWNFWIDVVRPWPGLITCVIVLLAFFKVIDLILIATKWWVTGG